MLKMQAQAAIPTTPKGPWEGGSKGSQSNACPDELHEDDCAKYLIYLNYDYYGHGGTDKIEGTQEYVTYHIQDMSDK